MISEYVSIIRGFLWVCRGSKFRKFRLRKTFSIDSSKSDPEEDVDLTCYGFNQPNWSLEYLFVKCGDI